MSKLDGDGGDGVGLVQWRKGSVSISSDQCQGRAQMHSCTLLDTKHNIKDKNQRSKYKIQKSTFKHKQKNKKQNTKNMMC